MKILDISAAALVGVLTTAAIVGWSPVPYEAAAHGYRQDVALRNLLAHFLSEHGLVWLQQSTFIELCRSLGASGNSTVTLSALRGSASCVAGPPTGSAAVSLEVPLPTGQVTLEAWESGGR
jgi:hypothetical protein